MMDHTACTSDIATRVEISERERGIATARSYLHGRGQVNCVDCGSAIAPARRAALPSARRCTACQMRLEAGRR